MMIGVGQSIRLALAAAHVTSASPWTAAYFNHTAASNPANVPQSLAKGTTNGTTAVTVIAAPATGTTSHLQSFSLRNSDTSSLTVTIDMYQSSVSYPVMVATLTRGDVLHYEKNRGWYVLDNRGREKTGGTVIVTGGGDYFSGYCG